MTGETNPTAREVARLLDIMRRLRDPETGCPWDIEQTFETIAPYTIEEAYEVADAISRGAHEDLRDELGDLLLQVVYHARMAEEAGRFDFEDVVRGISEKMIRRHPHVFGAEDRDKTPTQQTADWERIKAQEREAGPGAGGALDGVIPGLPALTRALKLQKRAARVGFDWPEPENVVEKIAEEARELLQARGHADKAEIQAEFGDMLFAMTNLARWLDIDPEAALRATNAKFTTRFQAVEAALAARGRTPEQSSLEEMDALWDAAKASERG